MANKTKQKLYITFSHELMLDELNGNGDLCGLGEKQEYIDYYVFTAKDKKEAITKAFDEYYNQEKNDFFFNEHTVSAFFKNIIDEPFLTHSKINKDDMIFLVDLSQKMNEAFSQEEEMYPDKNKAELISIVLRKFDANQIMNNLDTKTHRIIWEEFSARGRIGILEATKLEDMDFGL